MSKKQFIKDGYTGRMLLQFCPVCFHKLDGISNMTGQEKPEPGDFTVCIECANVLRFNDKMELDLSSLMEVPTSARMNFARVVTLLKEVKGIM